MSEFDNKNDLTKCCESAMKSTMKGILSDTGEEFYLPEDHTPRAIYDSGKIYVYRSENVYEPVTWFDINSCVITDINGDVIEQ